MESWREHVIVADSCSGEVAVDISDSRNSGDVGTAHGDGATRETV